LTYLVGIEDAKSYQAVDYRGWGELPGSLLAADKGDFSRNFPDVLNFQNSGCTRADCLRRWAGEHQQRAAKARAVKAKGSTLENSAACAGLALAATVAFAFCTQA